MKRILKSKIIDKKFTKEIIKERNLMSKLNHPFLVNMHFSFQDNKYLYMILDLMKGGDLRYYCNKYHSEEANKQFTEKECNFMVTNLILALEYIHKNNLLHCDIKPENIVIDENGYFYLTDFGIALDLKEEEKNKKNKFFGGSLGYMAPEVMFQEKINFCVDYFALGAVCYEMMMGKLPYFASNLEDMKKLIMANQVQIKKFIIPKGWSQQAADFINKLIQRKQNKRLGYNDIDEIKKHPWLINTNWKKVYLHEIKSPFEPDINKKIINDSIMENESSKNTLERYKNIEMNKEYKYYFDDFYYFNKYSMNKEINKFINPHLKYENKKMNDLEDIEFNSDNKYSINNSNNNRYFLTSNI